MKTEPAITVSSITAVVAALLSLFVIFGLPLSGDQQAAIVGAVGVVASFVVGIVTRTQVTPAASVVAAVNSDGKTVAGPAASQTTGTPVVIAAPPDIDRPASQPLQ